MCFLVPFEHGVDRLLELGEVVLVDATCVYPDIAKSISFSLLGTEPDLSEPDFCWCVTIEDILEGDFVCRLAPRVRQDGVFGDLVVTETLSEG